MAETTNITTGELPVAEAMHTGVITCDARTPLDEVAKIMADAPVHCVVVNQTGPDQDEIATWGIVSDLDLVAALASSSRPDAGQMAATPIVSVRQDESIERAAQLMTEYSAAHLVVLDQDERQPVGVLSTLDIARVLAGQGSR